jgi:hypothetical protein
MIPDISQKKQCLHKQKCHCARIVGMVKEKMTVVLIPYQTQILFNIILFIYILLTNIYIFNINISQNTDTR